MPAFSKADWMRVRAKTDPKPNYVTVDNWLRSAKLGDLIFCQAFANARSTACGSRSMMVRYERA
jgi:hypothetical protein